MSSKSRVQCNGSVQGMFYSWGTTYEILLKLSLTRILNFSPTLWTELEVGPRDKIWCRGKKILDAYSREFGHVGKVVGWCHDVWVIVAWCSCFLREKKLFKIGEKKPSTGNSRDNHIIRLFHSLKPLEFRYRFPYSVRLGFFYLLSDLFFVNVSI